jgi:hypothetical protein
MKEKTTQLVDRLLDLPKLIEDFQTKALAVNDAVQETSELIVSRESEIKSEINAATDENGKKLYSNEESRKIAFLADSKEDSTLTHLYSKMKELNHQVSIIRIAIESYSNEQRNIRSILGVINSISES